MTLSLYIARRFLWMFTRVTGAFMGILMLIDVIDQMRRNSGTGHGIGDALYMAMLNVPETLYRILPLLMILSSIALFLGLARSSELVVVRAAGRSGLRFLVAPVGAALAIGLLAVAVLNPLVAATSKEYDRLSAERGGGGSILSLSAEGLWMRQGSEDGQTVIHADLASPDGELLRGVTFYLFDADGRPAGRIDAETARLTPGAWAMTKAKRWDFTAANPEMAATVQEEGLSLPTDLTADRIRQGFGTPSAIAFWDLPGYIGDLEQAGFSARSYRVWMQMELALPLLLGTMVLLAAGFTMRHARFGKTGQMVLLALAGGFLLFFLRNFAQVLGENGQIPVAVAAWSPPAAAFLLSLTLLLHLEDG
ncbi:MAG: LPS export ABC transporter permease LptG [Rhodobacteraceae bacterium]|nr:LPS export ABC transporter permease LptG [Paracoccaceae bacterium]